MTEFNEWDSFYLIVGGAAGALIGLQFVVLTLIAARPQRPEVTAGQAFSTPTVLDFCVVLLIAAIVRAPWHSYTTPSVIWAIVAVLGIGYCFLTLKRLRSQNAYDPELVDWLSYFILPLVAYVVLLVSAFMATDSALFGVAAAVLLLLFIGIYNAWDTITYHVFKPSNPAPRPDNETDASGDGA